MYTSRPPSQPDPSQPGAGLPGAGLAGAGLPGAALAGTNELRVAAAARRRFNAPPAIAARPGHREHLRAYLSDLVAPYQLALREELATDRAGHSYGEMAAVLVAELAPPQQPIDLLVLAFANPDVRPGRATATYLSERCPGNPLAFAICDQGAAAAFTGLRLIAEYARTGECQRSLLLVVEQAAVPYYAGVAVDPPSAHTAVGLRCETTGPTTLAALRQHPQVSEEQVAPLLAAELAALAPATGVATCLIADTYLAGKVGPAESGGLRISPAGQPHTGGWWELVSVLEAARAQARPSRVVLANYDRQLRYLCLSAVDISPGQ